MPRAGAWLPLVCGAGQLLVINLSYLVAAWHGHVPWCIPYWDGCASISATGRRMPEAVIFKGAMLPLALCVAIYWRDIGRALRDTALRRESATAWMQRLGIGAALLLAVYVVLLGIAGDWLARLRHLSVLLSFTLTYLAQLLLTREVLLRQRARQPIVPAWLPGPLTALSAVTLSVGIGNVLLGWLYTGYESIEDAIEWNLAALLNLHFIFACFVRAQGEKSAAQ
jgi:hypothetical protein